MRLDYLPAAPRFVFEKLVVTTPNGDRNRRGDQAKQRQLGERQAACGTGGRKATGCLLGVSRALRALSIVFALVLFRPLISQHADVSVKNQSAFSRLLHPHCLAAFRAIRAQNGYFVVFTLVLLLTDKLGACY